MFGLKFVAYRRLAGKKLQSVVSRGVSCDMLKCYTPLQAKPRLHSLTSQDNVGGRDRMGLALAEENMSGDILINTLEQITIYLYI